MGNVADISVLSRVKSKLVLIIIFLKANKQMIEFQKSGGVKKMKEITQNDVAKVKKDFKELFSYDLPQQLKKFFRDLKNKLEQR